MKQVLYLFLAALPLFGEMPPVRQDKKVAFQNTIVAKVNGTTISMMDVKKKLDMFFHQYYPDLVSNDTARLQFYERSWRQILMEMIDNELILADAEDHEVKVTDSEVRETMESRFGPSVLTTLDKIGLTYDDAWKLVKNDLIVQRMSWFFIQSKAIQSVTPSSIREAYKHFLKENPPHQELKYRIVTIQGQKLEKLATSVHELLVQNGKSPELMEESLHDLDPAIQISSEYAASDLEISESHRSILSTLLPGSYSEIAFQKNRAGKNVARIFYLVSLTDHPVSPFQEESSTLREKLIQKAIGERSMNYLEKLRNHYGFDTAFLKERLPEDMHPFSLQ